MDMKNVQGQIVREISCRRMAWRKQCWRSGLIKKHQLELLGTVNCHIGKIRLTEKECMSGERSFIGLEKPSPGTVSGIVFQRKCPYSFGIVNSIE